MCIHPAGSAKPFRMQGSPGLLDCLSVSQVTPNCPNCTALFLSSKDLLS